ncbi:MAG: hypothetical protein ACOC4G_12380 [Bacillota bacterium]
MDKRLFIRGDLKIEYNYTKLDEFVKAVNIIYIQATGSGEGPYKEDIMDWAHLREVPSMNKYYDNMHTYHISYAAAPGTDREYIRARRYTASGLGGTEIKPDYNPDDFFAPGVKHHISIIKLSRKLYMYIKNPEKSIFCYWHNTDYPPVEEGYVGLRHMYTQIGRYQDFRISKLN